MTEPAKAILKWQRWPLREDGQRAWLRAGAVVLLLGLIGGVLLVSLPTATALVLGVPVALALLPYFLPRQYRVSDEGLVVVRGFWNDRREWQEFRAYLPVAGGYWLLPAPASTRPRLNRALGWRAFYLPRPLETPTALALESQLAQRLQIQA